MKKIFFILFLFSLAGFVTAQDHVKDSLLTLLSKTKEDTLRVNLLSDLSNYYDKKSMPDSAIFWAIQGLALARKTANKKDEINHTASIAYNSWKIGDYTTAIKLGYSIFEYGKSINDSAIMVSGLPALINGYRDQGDYREALKYTWKIFDLTTMDSAGYALGYAVIGSIYYGLGKFDSAFFYLKKAVMYQKTFLNGWVLLMAGRTSEKLNNDSAALVYYRQSIMKLLEREDFKYDLAGAYNSIASLYEKKSQSDSAIYYANQALIITQQDKFNKEKAETYLILSKVYEKVNTSMAFDYYKLAISARDSLYNQEKQRQISSFKLNEELNQAEFRNKFEQSQLKYRNRFNMYVLFAGILVLLLITGGLWRRNIYKQRSFALLEKQKREIDIQKEKAEATLEELKSTQAQLIQSEKMASLGELTAGIAHEIQNPLNFVNNFSELNTELVAEMKNEMEKGNLDEAKAIANDVEENEQKIKHHGKRADAIVKSMLQHAKVSGGQKELTDLNKLTDEYLRLSYHGMRAKDKSFQATLQTDFDADIDKVNVIPQDMGKALLNLFNNAFYAVHEKKSRLNGTYEPEVSVRTKKTGNKIEISIKDNGTGIPQKAVDKIFQPFFTTKPTGQGTGLGLSLSYDIIKAHGGEIKVETKEGEGAEFMIYLPAKENV